MSHTKGPWKRTVGGDWVTAHDGGNIAHVRGQTVEQNQANACLIAAAPDMRSALDAIERISDRCVNADHYTAEDALTDLAAIRSEVAKAAPPPESEGER